jgi:hypothetical protein
MTLADKTVLIHYKDINGHTNMNMSGAKNLEERFY